MRKRIWELDAFRGVCVLGMVLVHFVLDVTMLYSLVDWQIPGWFIFLQNWGGVLFLLISGISVTFSRNSLRRGFWVFSCGMLITAATVGMYLLGIATRSIIIYFGVLQCLGICMALWPLFQKLPLWALSAIGTGIVLLGLFFTRLPPTEFYWLIPLGIPCAEFYTADYFPLFPYLGFFLLGAALGRALYRNKQTLLPKVNANHPLLRFLQFCGKYSLFIYMLHQPILSGLCMLLSLL